MVSAEEAACLRGATPENVRRRRSAINIPLPPGVGATAGRGVCGGHQSYKQARPYGVELPFKVGPYQMVQIPPIHGDSRTIIADRYGDSTTILFDRNVVEVARCKSASALL